MHCLICGIKHNNKTFCSHKCRNAWVKINNTTNNPIWNDESRKKMQAGLTGKKQSEKTKLKRSLKLKKYYKENPDARERLAKNVWDKYTSKIAGTSWQSISKKVRERDNYTCQKCGESQKRVIVHHLDWRGKERGRKAKDYNNELSNLLTLCDKCHNNIHRHKSKDYNHRKKSIQQL